MEKRHGCRLILGMAMLFSVGTAAAQETYIQSIKPYNAALTRLCPEKHLENLDPGELDVIIENFVSGLSDADASRWNKAAQPMCVNSVAGVSCVNSAFVRAATKLGKVDQLAKAVCDSKYACSLKWGDCKAQP